MYKYRSYKIIHGRNMSGVRSLLRATGVRENDFGKPIIAIVNSFTDFVPGHIHLKNVGVLIAKQIKKYLGIPKEFNTIAIDDGIAMGHSGMLYSLPSRDLIADSIEYMVNAHCIDGMVCVSNCDKITPGMLMASLRLNIPSVFVSGGPMEAGKIFFMNKNIKLDLVDSITFGANKNISDKDNKKIERQSCPTCGSCSGMFTANSMNCLTEVLGLSQPGNGTLLATHIDRKKMFLNAGKLIMNLVNRYYCHEDVSCLPRNIANKKSFMNSMMLDISMGGSTNTVLHLLAAAKEANVNFTLNDVNSLSLKIPYLCKISPATKKYHVEDFHRAGGVFGILGELNKYNFLYTDVYNILGLSLEKTIKKYNILTAKKFNIRNMYAAGPGGKRTVQAFSQSFRWSSLDTDRLNGCIRSINNSYNKLGGLIVLYGNLAKDGCLLKLAKINKNKYKFIGPSKVFESQEDASNAILANKISPGDVIVIRYEGPKGGPGMQEMLYPTSFLKSVNLDKCCALITDGRFSGGTSGLSIGHISPEAANKGLIGIVKNNDFIYINLKKRIISLKVSKKILKKRIKEENFRGKYSWKPYKRNRKIPLSLKIYSYFVTSADKGAVRDKNKL